MNTIEMIENNEVYKQVIKDSFGGVMYNVANRDKYDSLEIIALWTSLSKDQQDMANGIVKGAMQFLTEKDIWQMKVYNKYGHFISRSERRNKKQVILVAFIAIAIITISVIFKINIYL